MSRSVAFESHNTRVQMFAAAEATVAEEDEKVVIHLVLVVMGEWELVRWLTYQAAKVKHRPLQTSEVAG